MNTVEVQNCQLRHKFSVPDNPYEMPVGFFCRMRCTEFTKTPIIIKGPTVIQKEQLFYIPLNFVDKGIRCYTSICSHHAEPTESE